MPELAEKKSELVVQSAAMCGSAVRQDGKSASLTAPNGSAQRTLLVLAMRRAAVSADVVGGVEAHGTGTPLGDPTEAGALAAVHGTQRGSRRPAALGTVKASVGHAEPVAGLFGVPKSERHTDEILEMVGLTEQADFYSRRLSGGMRRRLLVGKAMVHRPPILVLDEPTAGVDVALRQRLWDSIKSLNQAGVTVVLTTHYLEEAEALCDRIAIVNKGEIIAAKTKADLLASAGQKTLHLSLTTAPPLPLPFGLADALTARRGKPLCLGACARLG